jgi:hypothetical protein
MAWHDVESTIRWSLVGGYRSTDGGDSVHGGKSFSDKSFSEKRRTSDGGKDLGGFFHGGASGLSAEAFEAQLATAVAVRAPSSNLSPLNPPRFRGSTRHSRGGATPSIDSSPLASPSFTALYVRLGDRFGGSPKPLLDKPARDSTSQSFNSQLNHLPDLPTHPSLRPDSQVDPGERRSLKIYRRDADGRALPKY